MMRYGQIKHIYVWLIGYSFTSFGKHVPQSFDPDSHADTWPECFTLKNKWKYFGSRRCKGDSADICDATIINYNGRLLIDSNYYAEQAK